VFRHRHWVPKECRLLFLKFYSLLLLQKQWIASLNDIACGDLEDHCMKGNVSGRGMWHVWGRREMHTGVSSQQTGRKLLGDLSVR
jgi:hypothetical protein